MMSRLYLSNLLHSVHREDLEDEFSKYGALKDVWVSQNYPGFVRFAYVEYEDETNANDAVSNMNDAEYFGSRIKVEIMMSTLCVRNLSDSVRREDLEDEFSKYGALKNVWVSQILRFAFVEYEDETNANDAVSNMNDAEYFGSRIKVMVFCLSRFKGTQSTQQKSKAELLEELRQEKEAREKLEASMKRIIECLNLELSCSICSEVFVKIMMSGLCVRNLSDSVRREDLEDEFSKYGALKNVWVSQTHTRYAFVDYEDETNANDAVSNMNDAEYFGSRIKVKIMMSRLYVSNLLDSVRREDLEDEFSKYGALKNVYVSQTHTRYAFVDYEDETNANDAVSNMNDAEYFGSRIKVEVPPSCLSRFKGTQSTQQKSKAELLEELRQEKEAREKLEASMKRIIECLYLELSCSICSEVFVKPVKLPCLHTFCQTCILQWERNQRDCPMCRAKYTTVGRADSLLVCCIEKLIESTYTQDEKLKRAELVAARVELEKQFLPSTSDSGQTRGSRGRNSGQRGRGIPAIQPAHIRVGTMPTTIVQPASPHQVLRLTRMPGQHSGAVATNGRVITVRTTRGGQRPPWRF
ncbi:uncharacterized protein LOC136037984 [Artemia franciscana]|uniref:uncharacterized protein LOC136037984 n=1 Tax=Artemia franciscana TaxID=6661 RepID=UPI0032DAD189